MSLGLLHSTQGPAWHLMFETLAYAVAGIVLRRGQRGRAGPPAADRLFLLGCAVAGAALGSLALHVTEHLPLWLTPQADWHRLVGKSVLGGLVGGTLGVEAGKRMVGWRASTGDAWVPALALGLMIGRVGCQLSGTWDQTYGNPTSLPWAWDYGDGVGRHPVAAYEIVLAGLSWWWVNRSAKGAPGTRFAAFLCLYCMIRLVLDFLKPPFAPAAAGSLPTASACGLTAIQWLALLAAPAYGWLWHARAWAGLTVAAGAPVASSNAPTGPGTAGS